MPVANLAKKPKKVNSRTKKPCAQELADRRREYAAKFFPYI